MGNEITNAAQPLATCDDLLSLAVNSGDVEVIRQLMDLRDRDDQRRARQEFVRAMADFRSECPKIVKKGVGYEGRYTYVKLPDALEAIKALECKHGLNHSWETDSTSAAINVKCTVQHVGGHCVSTSLSADADKTGSKNSVQAIGSTVSYLERYTLFALLGIAGEDQDDDSQTSDVITEEQVAHLRDLLKKTDRTEEAFCTYAKVASLEETTGRIYNTVVPAMERKAAE